MTKIVPVILCGGSGRRLWPRSRRRKPKPFLPLLGPSTLFDEALLRCSNADQFAPPVIVTGENYLDFTETDLAIRLGSQIIVEPEAKNTAAAVALAAHRLPRDSVMLVCPSDHHIEDQPRFVEAARKAAEVAADGWLVCLSIEARAPEPRFGYLRRGASLGEGAFKVAEFIEKPDRSRAEAFAASDEYSWNAGIFAFQAGDYIDEFERLRPSSAAAIRRSVEKGRTEKRRFFPDLEEFSAIEPESLDYAVMEDTDRAAMVPARIGWSDLGNWLALHAARSRDKHGNSARGPVEMVNCRNVMVDSDGLRVSLIGLENVIVVVDGDDIMITSAQSAHHVAKLSRATDD